MRHGIVKYFNDTRGWGIIGVPGQSEDYYVHYTSIDMEGYKTLRSGQTVRFTPVHTSRGRSAVGVSLLD